jgi:hypothetical protein
MPGCATLGSFAQGLQGQVFQHQIGLPGSDAVPENTGHPHCRTAGQRAQAVGFGGEHFGQTGVVQFDEIALPGALDQERARDRAAADVADRVDARRRSAVAADHLTQGFLQRAVQMAIMRTHGVLTAAGWRLI